ncbi:hypothetical protein [Streptomyces sp. NBC_01716]|uniref:hypothetical protein n=1 Tax=Streptomyces sp. NBC_01716 TaxID=2975917 RepID=UPI002E37A3B8|nr:hypothetical protein [Streptomyces sp. NBC_01716]
MFDKLRRLLVPSRTATPVTEPAASPRARTRQHNLFEAAASFVAATADDDQDRMDEASGWVSPEALSFGVSELACRAVTALARERDESPEKVARTLLGLPAA